MVNIGYGHPVLIPVRADPAAVFGKHKMLDFVLVTCKNIRPLAPKMHTYLFKAITRSKVLVLTSFHVLQFLKIRREAVYLYDLPSAISRSGTTFVHYLTSLHFSVACWPMLWHSH